MSAWLLAAHACDSKAAHMAVVYTLDYEARKAGRMQMLEQVGGAELSRHEREAAEASEEPLLVDGLV